MKRKSMIIALMVLFMFVIMPCKAEAGNGVQNKINELRNMYPNNSYFSANGSACSHGQNYTCSNCQLSYVINNRHPEYKNAGLNDGWTCKAFSRFAYYYMFGLNSYNITSNSTKVALSNASLGDYVQVWGTGHAGIFLYASGGKYYLYESNVSTANRVGYALVGYSASDITGVYHANNYNSVDESTTNQQSLNISMSDKYRYNEDIVVSWNTISGADAYGLSIWKAPYNGDENLVVDGYVYGNSHNAGKLPIGTYRCKMASWSNGNMVLRSNEIYFTVEGDTEPPKITNAKVSNVSTTGYTVTCNVTDNIGVTKVLHPTWTAAGGQDDLAANWESNSSVSGTISGNTVTFRVKDADHNYEKGTYTTHIYAYDAAGNRTKVELPDVVVSNKGNKVSSTTYKGHTYILYDDNMTWKKAKEQCEKLGGHLAIISSKAENDAIISLMDKAGRNGYWIGAYRVLDTYIWLDGSSLTYNNWAANEPNNTNNMEDVAEIWKSGIWNDNARSDMSRGFILEIEPIAVTSVSLNKTSAALKTGETLQLTATVMPVNAADKSVVWTTSNSSVATVSNGKVYAKAEGKAVITAKAGGKQKQCSITVQEKNKNIAVKSIKLSKSNATVAKGNSIQLTASITPSNATNKSIEWSGNNNEVAIVSNSGKVTAKSVGTAVITAKIEGKTAKATIKVIPQKVKGVKTVKSGKDYIELSWKRQSGISGYTIYRYDSKYKKDVGIITIKESDTTKYKITRVNGLSGKKLTDGTAYTFKIAAYKTVNGKKIYGEKAAIVTATATKSPTIKLTRGKSKTIKVSWNKVNKADGYEVYMSKKKSTGYKKLKSLAGNGKTRYTTGKLDKNKIYYFRVRTYKKVKGKNIYSEYSKIKSIRIK